MKKLFAYLPFHFLIGLVAGICIEHFFHLWNALFSMLIGIFLILACGLLFTKKRGYFSIPVIYFFLILGMFNTYQSDDRNHSSFYDNLKNSNASALLRITEVLKPNAFSLRYTAEVIQIDSSVAVGNVLVSLKRDTLQTSFKVDDRIWIRANFQEIKPPLNPYQFDYKAYLERQGIYHQVYLKSNEFLQAESQISFLGWISYVRSRIQSSLKAEGFSQEEYGVMNALLLGQRQEVSKELLDDYSKAGAIHILAISGLHVGILLLILNVILKPLEVMKKGKFIKLILIVLLLWFFALLAGMSASVIRAVTMFTAVAIGQSIQRKNSVVYSLVFSMFVLLLFKPMFLFDVGFQLSYLAVYGIVTIQPKLANLWKPKWKILDKIWQLTTVSLAAQLTVLPLSLYYFHQFPGLFLLSNLVIVPCLGMILIGGILIILLSVSSLLPDALVHMYGTVISWMNAFIRLVSEQESFLFEGISFSASLLVTSYLMIMFGYRFFEQKKANRLVYALICLLLFQTIFLIEKFEKQAKEEFIVFHKSRAFLYGVREGEVLAISDSLRSDYTLTTYEVGENVQSIYDESFRNYIRFQDEQIVVIDSLGIYNVKGLVLPIILLQHSPKINLKRMIDALQPKQIIADGSNYRSLVELWKKTCEEENIPFWLTGESGAYVLISD
jgi:competence protein ComEC